MLRVPNRENSSECNGANNDDEACIVLRVIESSLPSDSALLLPLPVFLSVENSSVSAVCFAPLPLPPARKNFTKPPSSSLEDYFYVSNEGSNEAFNRRKPLDPVMGVFW